VGLQLSIAPPTTSEAALDRPKDRAAVWSRQPGQFRKLRRRDVPDERQHVEPEHLPIGRWSVGLLPLNSRSTALCDLGGPAATRLSAMAPVGPGIALTPELRLPR
jgi:hypothetical protein